MDSFPPFLSPLLPFLFPLLHLSLHFPSSSSFFSSPLLPFLYLHPFLLPSITFPLHLLPPMGTLPSPSVSVPLANFSSSSSSSSSTSSDYIGADELCTREHQLRYCNLHNSAHLCICYAPADRLPRGGSPLCPRLLRLDSLEYLVLTISVSFPVPHSFRSDPDSIFAEDLELFAGIGRSSVFILRKGCAPDRRSFQFQFGILRPNRNKTVFPIRETDLRLVHPRTFTRNLNFMRQKGLLIARVEQTKFLRPLIGFSDWIYRDQLALRGVGLCHRRDPLRCYRAEMALLFLVGLFAGAECCRTLLWRIFALRHGARQRAGRGGGGGE